MTSDVGLLKSLELTLRLVASGLLFGALPCQSFGFMSCGTHGRDAATPYGNNFPFVLVGNLCAIRFAMLACIAMARGCFWMLENPGRTTIYHLPAIQLLLHPCLRPRTVRWILPQFVETLYWKIMKSRTIRYIHIYHNIYIYIMKSWILKMGKVIVQEKKHSQPILVYLSPPLMPWLRWMGMFGGWSVKPQFGLGNVPGSYHGNIWHKSQYHCFLIFPSWNYIYFLEC